MLRILLVEDDQFNRTIIEDAFEFDNIPAELLCVESGEEAIERAIESRPDLILMDVQLPGIDGLETTRRLKQNPSTHDIPVWAFTAHAMKGDDELARQAGCCEYVTKPVNVQALGNKIRQFIEQLETQEVDHV